MAGDEIATLFLLALFLLLCFCLVKVCHSGYYILTYFFAPLFLSFLFAFPLSLSPLFSPALFLLPFIIRLSFPPIFIHQPQCFFSSLPLWFLCFLYIGEYSLSCLFSVFFLSPPVVWLLHTLTLIFPFSRVLTSSLLVIPPRLTSSEDTTAMSTSSGVDHAVIGGVVAVIVFILLCLLIVLGRYLIRHKGQQLCTNKPADALIHSCMNIQRDKLAYIWMHAKIWQHIIPTYMNIERLCTQGHANDFEWIWNVNDRRWWRMILKFLKFITWRYSVF